MKTLRLMVVSILFAAIFAVSAFAQGTAKSNIVLVNTQAFVDQKAGITKILNGYKRLETELKPEYDKYEAKGNQFTTLKKSYDTLVQNAQKNIPINNDDLQTKRDQLQNLQTDLKRMEEDIKIKQSKREGEILGPILEEIDSSMQAFAKQKGYSLVMDIGRLANAQMLLYMDASVDITKEFIAFYNAKPAGTATK